MDKNTSNHSRNAKISCLYHSSRTFRVGLAAHSDNIRFPILYSLMEKRFRFFFALDFETIHHLARQADVGLCRDIHQKAPYT